MNEVGIVVVTYNRLSFLKEVVGSLRLQSYQKFRIIIVNNGSTDGTLEWLEGEKDLITINQANLGGAGGFYTGMKYVAEHGFKYCWVMDDDVVCSPTSLEELIKAYQAKPNIGFVCSKVIGIDGCPMNVPEVDINLSENGYPDFCDLISHQMVKVKTATFVSILFSVQSIIEKGLPYKEFFIWADDTEYTARLSLDKDCYVACKSVVTHKRSVQGSLSIDKEKDPKRMKMFFYSFRNVAYYKIKYYGCNKFRLVLMYLNQVARLMLKGKFNAAKILLYATFALISFSPTLEFPNVEGVPEKSVS